MISGFYNILRRLLLDMKDETFTMKDILEWSELSEPAARRHILNLQKYGFVVIVSGGRGDKPNVYKLKGVEEIEEFIRNCFE